MLIFPLQSAQIAVLAVVTLFVWNILWMVVVEHVEVVMEVRVVVLTEATKRTWRAIDDSATFRADTSKMRP